jgi:DNA ligase-1
MRREGPVKFKPMLGVTIRDPQQLTYPVAVSAKLDGVRCLVQDGQLVSRNLKPIPNVHIQKSLGLFLKLDGLDGELIVGSPTAKDVFQTTQSAVMSKAGEPDFKFHVFDLYDRMASFQDRDQRLEVKLAGMCGTENIIQVKQHIIYSAEQLLKLEEHYLTEGYEGLIMRSLGSQYKQGRSTLNEGALIKLKRFADAEAVVIGMEEKLHNGNTAIKNALGQLERSSKKSGMVGTNTMGTLQVRGINGPFKGMEFGVGSGFTDAQRAAIWGDPKLIGKVLTYKYFPVGCKDAPRFPVFKGFRAKEDMS